MAQLPVSELPEHSPLGFSGAERYRHCPGSVALILGLPPDMEEADPEYRVAGTAAHEAWAWCLKNGAEAWEAAGQDWNGYTLTAEDLAAGQFYLDDVRSLVIPTREGHRETVIVLVEEKIHAPEIHEHAFGTLDYALVCRNWAAITDYKHGEGVYVAAAGNWQLMGYAALLLSRFPNIEQFLLRINQPRFEGQAKVREWKVTAECIRTWVRDELQPAMRNAWSMVKGKPPTYEAGEWCRFCPAVGPLCPAHNHNLAVVEQSGMLVERLSNEKVGELMGKVEPLEMMIKKIKAEATRRRLAGIEIANCKTVVKKAFRVWKSSAEPEVSEKFGNRAFKTAMLSPAEFEKEFGARGKAFTKEYAFTPDNGLTIAPLSDPRKAVTVQKPSETFAFALTNNKK